MPLMGLFVCESILLVLAQLGELLEAVRVTRDEGSAGEEFGVLGQAVRLCEDLGISCGLVRGAALNNRIISFDGSKY